MTDKPISKGPKKRNPVCYQVLHDIVIPAGTILRHADDKRGGSGYVETALGFGKGHVGHFVIELYPDGEVAEAFKKVIG